jgi:radical SAM superfamily enzyme YgiQ (UPF0313 family)
MPTNQTDIEFLFVHVPKYSNYYRPADDFTFINYIPMGVFALADRLNRSGVSSRITHLGLETILDKDYSIVDRVRSSGAKIVGMSLHWHYQSFDVLDVAAKIKKACPTVAIVLGGFTASRFPVEILENFPAVDAIIAGDAEASVVPFAKTVLAGDRDFRAVANCFWRREGKIVDNGFSYSASTADLDALDFANLGLLDHHDKYRDYFRLPMFWMNNAPMKENLNRRIGAEKMFPLALGRGCQVNCTFCGGSQRAHKRLFNRDVPVFRSATAVVDSMEKALSYGYTGFISCFDPCPGEDGFLRDMMAEVRRRGLKCGLGFECWGLPTRAAIDDFRKTFVMKDSYLAVSPESGSEEIRRRNKGIYFSNQELFATLDYLKTVDVPAVVYLTAGLPGETRADLETTAAFARELKARYSSILTGVFCLPIQMEPGSMMFEDPAGHGVKSTRSCFMDFYRSHGTSDSGPFTYLGYGTDSLALDPDDLADTILDHRCHNFCLISPKLFGRFAAPARIGRFLCGRMQKRWLREGHGKPAKERRTFR